MVWVLVCSVVWVHVLARVFVWWFQGFPKFNPRPWVLTLLRHSPLVVSSLPLLRVPLVLIWSHLREKDLYLVRGGW